MKRFVLPLIVLFSLLLSTSCVSPFFNPPVDQDGTIWVSEEPQMFFIVDNNLDMGNIGYTVDGSGIKLLFKYSFSVDVLDYAKYAEAIEGPGSELDTVLFSGKCTFGFTRFSLTVEESVTDDIKIGDVITFKRVDKVPDWAEEIETTTT